MTHTPEYSHAMYLEALIETDKLKESIRKAVSALQGRDFEAVAFRGMSGALIAPSIALALDKTMLMVRKATENTHSCHIVEGDRAVKRYVIIDDFVGSGMTAQAIVDAVKGFAPFAQCLGVLEVNNLPDDPGPRYYLKRHTYGYKDDTFNLDRESSPGSYYGR